jgi:hypothetical protein
MFSVKGSGTIFPNNIFNKGTCLNGKMVPDPISYNLSLLFIDITVGLTPHARICRLVGITPSRAVF